jgi:hypothetical protein
MDEPQLSNPKPPFPPALKFIDMPIVLLGEDSAEYAQLRQQIEDYVRPLDIFERMNVSDLAYYSWESLRYRKIIANLVDASKRYALERILRPLLPRKEISEVTWVSPQFEPPSEAEVVSRAYFRDDPEAIAKVDRLMKEREVGWDAVRAEAVSLNLEQIDRLKRPVSSISRRSWRMRLGNGAPPTGRSAQSARRRHRIGGSGADLCSALCPVHARGYCRRG